REAVRLLERTGDQWEVNIARYQIAASLYRLGDLRGAVAEAQRMHQSGLDLSDPQAAGISLDIWARAALGKIAHEVVSAELHRHRDDVQAAAQVGLAEGVRLLKAGRPGQAAEILEHSHQLVKAAGIRNAWVSPLLPWLTTALRQEAQATTNLTPARRRSLLRRAHTVVVKGLRV